MFQYHVALIYCSHIKCMTTEPGLLAKDYDELDFSLMSKDLKEAIVAVKAELKLEQDQFALLES